MTVRNRFFVKALGRRGAALVVSGAGFLFAATTGCSSGDGGRVLTCSEGERLPCACTDGTSGYQMCDGATGTFGICGGCGQGAPPVAPGMPAQPVTDPNATVPPPNMSVPPEPAPSPDPLPEPPPVEPEPPPVTEPVPPPANPNQEEVPTTDYCAPVSTWDPLWTQWEDEVLFHVNEYRAQGANCGGLQMGAIGPLTMNANLRCAARVHTLDQAMLNFMSHTGSNGSQMDQRISAAGYGGWSMGENVAQGYGSPYEVVAGWMTSPGHCTNIMGGFQHIGVGYHPGQPNPWGGSSHHWTQNFGG